MNRRTFLAAALVLPGCAGLSRRLRPLDRSRLGASTACLAGFSLIEALEKLRSMRFQTVELIAYTGARHSVGDIPGFDFAAAGETEREEVFAATRPFRHISAHLPFDFQLFAGDRERGLKLIKDALDGLAFLEGSLGVMHVGWPGEGQSFRDIWNPMIETLRMLGDYAGERGLTIGIETMQPNSAIDFTALVFDTDHPAIGATVDTGHIRGATDIELPKERRHTEEGSRRFNDVLMDLTEALEDKLVHVHLSDVRMADWKDHESVGTGIIDFPRFIATLRRMRYDGLMVFELEEANTVEALAASKEYVEALMT